MDLTLSPDGGRREKKTGQLPSEVFVKCQGGRRVSNDAPLIVSISCRFHLMPEGKHNLHLRFADEFNKLAEDFLR